MHLIRPLLGIPVLNRHDLLRRCVEAIDIPVDLLVINNNSLDANFRNEVTTIASPRGHVEHQDRNLGVAASWNAIARRAQTQGRDFCIIGSNDTFLSPGALSLAMDRYRTHPNTIWHIHAWNFFLLPIHAWLTVGSFDENFYPAYMEDQDYAYRCTLCGTDRADAGATLAEHLGSQTIHSDHEYAIHNATTHGAWNRNHYLLKWGGLAGSERFTTPYNRDDVDHTWWPDPGGSIAVRDWDNGRRQRQCDEDPR